MRTLPFRRGPRSAFTLVELLVVIAIMALLLGATLLGSRGFNSSSRFTQAVSQVAGTLNEAHAYAVAQDTYVWVAFYTNAPSAGAPSVLYVGSYASNDGTDPINWTALTVPPNLTIADSTTTLSPVSRLRSFSATQVSPVSTTYNTKNPPNPSAGVPVDPATSPIFQTDVMINGAKTTLSSIGVIQFTPTGGANVSSSPVSSVGVGLQPLKGPGVPDPDNLATIWISGLTGLVTVYR